MVEITTGFLGYELHHSTQTLTYRGDAVSLRPKTLATLQFLLANRHRTVTKDEVLSAIWSDVEVQDQAVFQSISEIRSLLKGHECIETIRGRGYRWILPFDSDFATSAHLRRRWVAPLAAGLVALVGIITWWQAADDPKPFFVIVESAASPALLSNDPKAKSSIDQMLIHQLRRMGWDAQPMRDGTIPTEHVVIKIDVKPADTGVSLYFSLQRGSTNQSGDIRSTTPIGAIRDLAMELHGLLSLSATENSNKLSISGLFTSAKNYMDLDNYSLAESYLTVALSEQPNLPSVQLALAYTYQQMGRMNDSLRLARLVHRIAGQTNNRTDQMLSAIRLSQLLFKKSMYVDAEQFAREALDIASHINDLLVVAEAQEQLGEISLARGKIEAGKEQLTVALQYFSTFCPTGESRVSKRLLDFES